MAERKPLLPQHRYSHGQQLIAFPSASPSSPADRSSPVASSSRRLDSGEQQGAGPLERRPGLPKLSRECLWSEVKCYGRHILPVIFVNLVLIAVGLSVYFTHR